VLKKQNLGTAGNYLNIIKTICEKPTENRLHGERQAALPLRSRT
jgi:hypothetical protein